MVEDLGQPYKGEIGATFTREINRSLFKARTESLL